MRLGSIHKPRFTVRAAGATLMSQPKTFGPDNEGRDYGRELPRIGSLGTGGCMDSALVGKRLYVAGGRGLFIFDATDPRAPKQLGALQGLGRPRQLVVRGGFAYISARENGLYIVDVRDPGKPALLSQYDSVELATGLAVSGELCLLACRQYGVELVEVRDPARPRHLGIVRTGEAQSVVARDGIGYAGVWGTRELVTFDFKNPRAPRVLSRASLDGFGDGLCVRGKYLYAATGHHTKAWKYTLLGTTNNAVDPGWGRGHGLEVFDLSEPTSPKFLSRIKFPRLYALHWDMWDVEVSGRYAFVGDTHIGLTVVDISKPCEPTAVAWHRLPPREPGEPPEAIGGFAVGEGVVYLAGGMSDLHVVDASGLATPPPDGPDQAPSIPSIPPMRAVEDPRFVTWPSEGQVHGLAVDEASGTAWLACGMAGIEAVRLGERIERLARHDTAGIAFDVAYRGKRLYVAEGAGGLACYEVSGAGGLKLLGRHRPGETVKQVVVPPESGQTIPAYALLHVGVNLFQIVDVSDPAVMRVVLEDRNAGPLYGRQITMGLLGGRYASCFWHNGGLRWYDLAASPAPVKQAQELVGVGFKNGFELLPDRALLAYRTGYCLFDRSAAGHATQLTYIQVPSLNHGGKPTLHGQTLYIADRDEGRVSAVDLRDLMKPRLLWQLELPGNPEHLVPWEGKLLIAAGNQGLLVLTSGAPR
jgi:hypothetical protein